MTPLKKPLTDEESAERLAMPGEQADSPAGEHKDLDDMRALLRSYRIDATQWAERRSAGQPSLVRAARQQDRWAALPQWSLALVAVISIAGGIVHFASVGNTAEDEDVSTADVRPVAREASQADIAADNQLLLSIDEALSYHAASPVDSLHLRSDK